MNDHGVKFRKIARKVSILYDIATTLGHEKESLVRFANNRLKASSNDNFSAMGQQSNE